MIAVVLRLARRYASLFGSGPAVARLFHGLLGLVFLDAWLSLGAQVHVLVGRRGLLPAADFLARARDALSFASFPTLFWLGAGDTALTLGVVAGVVFAVAAVVSIVAFAGRGTRALAAAQFVLYLSYVTAGRTFFGFQWDALLLECACFAIFLPRDRPAPFIHLVFRLILFKLYWESGLAKWQSELHDWRDGSAMSYYFETAPLPTALAWYLHHLPAWWHAFESRATLAFELLVPLAIFGPRRARLAAFVIFGGFQIVNAASANYGFFCYLAGALHLFLLDDGDVVRAAAWLRARLRLGAATPPAPVRPRRAHAVTGALVLAVFVALSLVDALTTFVDSPRLDAALLPVRRLYAPWRAVNSYHLFASVTRTRIEPEFQTRGDGATWVAHDLRHKPGDPRRRPDWVAPHQPRVDFQLWFYGLGYRRGAPDYVATLLARLCRDPAAVQPLFAKPLPPHPRAVRIVFWDYHFSTAAERRATGAWWTRRPVDATEDVPCDTAFAPADR